MLYGIIDFAVLRIGENCIIFFIWLTCKKQGEGLVVGCSNQ